MLADENRATQEALTRLAKEAPRIAKATPEFLLPRRLQGRSAQFLELFAAAREALAYAVLVAIQAMLAAPPTLRIAPVAIAPRTQPEIRGIPIRAHAPPAVQHASCCRAR
mgnify:CR=1 FL=1